MVKTQPSHDSGEPGGEVVDGVDASKPQPSLLKDVIRIGRRPEYPGGQRDQPGPLDVEISPVHPGHTLLTQETPEM